MLLTKKSPLCVCLGLALAVVLSGCTQTKALLAKRDDGSLDYQSAQKLPPIQLPAHWQTAPFTPIYEVPTLSGEPMVQQGKQFVLPKPPTTIN